MDELYDVAYTLVKMHLFNALPVSSGVDVLLRRMFPDCAEGVLQTTINDVTVEQILEQMVMVPGLKPADCLGAMREARGITQEQAINIILGRGFEPTE